MKKIIVLLLATFALCANAEKYMETDNKAGGKIVLTDAKCPNYPTLRRAYATAPDQNIIFGCWAYITGQVFITYDNGNSRAMNPDNFRFVDTEKK